MAKPGYGVVPPNYRLPAATRVGAVRLQVSDLERSIAYYTTVLGFRILDRDGTRAALGAHGSDDTLVELHQKAGARSVARHARLGLYHFAILLPDRESLGRFVSHLGAAGVRAGAADHLVSEALYLHDPDGLGIEVYADRPRSQWRAVDGQLAMASNQLDVAALVAAGGAAPWSGMPAGTIIGHVHLHVGDIARAEAFYHEGLGLDKVVWSYPGALFLAAGGYHHHLAVNTWAGDASPAGDDDARLLEWEIVVPTTESAHAAIDSVEAGGHAATRTTDGGTARDPWGTQVRVRAFGGDGA